MKRCKNDPFIKFCGAVTVTLALPKAMTPQVAYALEQATTRPSVVWLEFQNCTGDIDAEGHIVVVEGSMPLKEDGIYCTEENLHPAVVPLTPKAAYDRFAAWQAWPRSAFFACPRAKGSEALFSYRFWCLFDLPPRKPETGPAAWARYSLCAWLRSSATGK